MKVALATQNGIVDSHFGHCEYFTVFTLNDNSEIISEETVQSPVGCGCKSNIAGTLARMGVKVMLAGNMGDGAVNVLGDSGIKVVRGCSGDVRSVAANWLAGEITDSGLGCQHAHAHDHDCKG